MTLPARGMGSRRLAGARLLVYHSIEREPLAAGVVMRATSCVLTLRPAKLLRPAGPATRRLLLPPCADLSGLWLRLQASRGRSAALRSAQRERHRHLRRHQWVAARIQ
eukprot:144114-Chlamydomonas_euryale.AAC.1